MRSVHPAEADSAQQTRRPIRAARAIGAPAGRTQRVRAGCLRPLVCLLALAAGALSPPASANTPGTLDTSFNQVGIALTQIGSIAEGRDVVIQPDGKMIVAGSAVVATTRDFALARYDANGTLDPGFSTDGIVTAGLGTGEDFCYAVALQPNGKIICAGQRGEDRSIGLIRFNTDGTIDSSFGSFGRFSVAIASLASWATGVVIQPDGKILVSAYVDNGGIDYRVGVVRILPNGGLDPSFASGGILTQSFAIGGSFSNALALQSDGKIVVGGTYIRPSGREDFLVLRYLGDGTPDTSFDGDGIVITDFNDSWCSVVKVLVQADGKIVATGMQYNGGFVAIARYLPDGALDPTFDGDGRVIYSGGGSPWINAVAVHTDGKIVTAGQIVENFERKLLLVRHNADGSLDTGFGSGGISTQFATGNDEVLGLAIQTDGKLVAAGRGGDRIAAARFHGDPPTNEVFANGFEQP